mgnify:CR=1 FL=1
MKKIITKTERLQIHGIIALGCIAAKQMEECDKALNEVLEAEDDIESGALNELYFENNPNVDRVLKILKITIKK